MAEDNGDVGAFSMGEVELRQIVGMAVVRCLAFLDRKLHRAIWIAKTYTRERIDDAAQAVRALQRVVPFGRLIAIHLPQETDPVRAAQYRLHLMRQADGLLRAPLRHQPGMQKQIVPLEQRQWTAAQPVQQFIAIRRIQDFVERIGFAGFADPVRHRQQMQIMVAEHAFGPLAHGADHAQGSQRLRTAVDQIAKENQPGARGGDIDFFEQGGELLAAALEVAYGVGGHGLVGGFRIGQCSLDRLIWH